MTIIVERESVSVKKSEKQDCENAFDVFVTSDCGCVYRHKGRGESLPFTEHQAIKLADRVREQGVIDPDHWLMVKTPEDIDKAIDRLTHIRQDARLAQTILIKMRAGLVVSKELKSLLIVLLGMTSHGIILELGKSGILSQEEISEKNFDSTFEIYLELCRLWNSEKKRAESSGEEPKSICYAGYRIGRDHPVECIGDGLEVDINEYESFPTIWTAGSDGWVEEFLDIS